MSIYEYIEKLKENALADYVTYIETSMSICPRCSEGGAEPDEAFSFENLPLEQALAENQFLEDIDMEDATTEVIQTASGSCCIIKHTELEESLCGRCQYIADTEII